MDILAKVWSKIWHDYSFSCHSLTQTAFTSVLLSTMRLTKKQRHLLKAFLLLLCFIEYYNRIRKREHLLQEAVLLPPKSPWHQLMDFGDLLSFLLMTGLTREAFDTLHDILKPPGYHCLRGQKGVSGHCHLMHSWAFYCSTWAARWTISICAWFLA